VQVRARLGGRGQPAAGSREARQDHPRKQQEQPVAQAHFLEIEVREQRAHASGRESLARADGHVVLAVEPVVGGQVHHEEPAGPQLRHQLPHALESPVGAGDADHVETRDQVQAVDADRRIADVAAVDVGARPLAPGVGQGFLGEIEAAQIGRVQEIVQEAQVGAGAAARVQHAGLGRQREVRVGEAARQEIAQAAVPPVALLGPRHHLVFCRIHRFRVAGQSAERSASTTRSTASAPRPG
jgi:hypothetical protein